MNRDSEHQPVREDMWKDSLLAENMGALQVRERLVISFFPHEYSGQADFRFKCLPLHGVHVVS